MVELCSIVDTTQPGCGSVGCIDPIFGPVQGFGYWSITSLTLSSATRLGAGFIMNSISGQLDSTLTTDFSKVSSHSARAFRSAC